MPSERGQSARDDAGQTASVRAETGSMTATAACGASGPDDRVCVLPPRHEGFHASRWGSEADFWLREAAMATAVRPHKCCDCPKQEPPLPCCNLGHDTGWVTVDGYRAEMPR